MQATAGQGWSPALEQHSRRRCEARDRRSLPKGALTQGNNRQSRASASPPTSLAPSAARIASQRRAAGSRPHCLHIASLAAIRRPRSLPGPQQRRHGSVGPGAGGSAPRRPLARPRRRAPAFPPGAKPNRNLGACCPPRSTRLPACMQGYYGQQYGAAYGQGYGAPPPPPPPPAAPVDDFLSSEQQEGGPAEEARPAPEFPAEQPPAGGEAPAGAARGSGRPVLAGWPTAPDPRSGLLRCKKHSSRSTACWQPVCSVAPCCCPCSPRC